MPDQPSEEQGEATASAASAPPTLSETPGVALSATTETPDARALLADIEEDMRRQMRELAQARLDLQSQKKASVAETERLLLAVLEAMDAFGRVFRSIQARQETVTPQMKIWTNNFRTVSRLLEEKVLKEQGVAKIENMADGFDPRWHRVAETTHDPTRPEGTILEEVRSGYLWRGSLLRKAEVKVVRHTPDSEAPDEDDAGTDGASGD